MKKTNLIILIVFTTLILGLLGTLLWFQCFNPRRGLPEHIDFSLEYQTLLSTEDALEDFDFAFDMVKSRHPIWLEKNPKAKDIKKSFINLYKEKREALSRKEEISVSELYQELSELFAILGDGHTRISFNTKEELYVDDFSYATSFGAPISINGISTDDLYQLFLSRNSYEVESPIKDKFLSGYIYKQSVLELLGFDTSKGVEFVYEAKDGTIAKKHKLVPQSKIFNPPVTYIKSLMKTHGYTESEIEEKFPQQLSKDYTNQTNYIIRGNPNNFVYYEINYDSKAALLHLSQCIYDEYYVETVKSFFQTVVDGNIPNIAVDLCGNGGGNSYVANEFIKHLDVDSYKTWDMEMRLGPILKSFKNQTIKNDKYSTNYSGNVYVLTDSSTYSSAMKFAMLIKDNNIGKVIGEPSSNKPSSYGDILQNNTPNSKLELSVSYKKWHRIDQSKSDELIEPDYPCNGASAHQNFLIIAFYNEFRGNKLLEETLPLDTILSTEEALEDFDFALELLKNRHPIWIENAEKAKSLKQSFIDLHQTKRKALSQKENITVLSLYKELSELYAILGDGHTHLTINSPEKIIDNIMYFGVYGTPIAINGIDIEDLYQVFLKRHSYEVETPVKEFFENKAILFESYLGLADIDTSKDVVFTYETKNGPKDVSHHFISQEDYVKPTKDEVALFLKNEGFSEEEIEKFLQEKFPTENTDEESKIDKSNICWYEIDSENNVGIFTLTECTNSDYYLASLKSFFADVMAKNISNIAVDLRGNGGGNSEVATEFIKYLDVQSYDFISSEYRNGGSLQKVSGTNKKNVSNGTNYSGNVYILTNYNSYSASMVFAQIIQDNKIGKIIGEPSGNKPNCYTSIHLENFPNSKLNIQISTQIQHRIDQSKGDSLLEPDYPCPSKEAINVLYEVIQK